MEYDASLQPVGIAIGQSRDIRGQGARHTRFLPLQWLARAAPRGTASCIISRPILPPPNTTAISFPLLTETPMEGSTMNTRIRNFLHEEDGVTALEYGILAAIVAVIIATVFRSGIVSVFDTIVSKLTWAVDKASA